MHAYFIQELTEVCNFLHIAHTGQLYYVQDFKITIPTHKLTFYATMKIYATLVYEARNAFTPQRSSTAADPFKVELHRSLMFS